MESPLIYAVIIVEFVVLTALFALRQNVADELRTLLDQQSQLSDDR